MAETVMIRGKYIKCNPGSNPFIPLHVNLDPALNPEMVKGAYTEWVEVSKDYDKATYEAFAKDKTPDGMRFVGLEEQEPPDAS